MANLTSLSSSFDDSSEDSCSICLEPFGIHDPSTVTCCKHEYHLHCILEWSQRSKECPICWQSLALKDPASQELLAAVEAEKSLRSRNIYSSSFTNSRIPLERLIDDNDDSCSDDSDFDEQIMQHLVAAASRARFVQRRERQRSSGAGPSEVLVFESSAHVSTVQRTLTTSPSGGSSPTSGIPSAVDIQPPTSAFSPIVDEVARNTSPESDVPYRPRVLYPQPPPESVRRLNTSEMFSLPESFKTKFSAASARYRESISKSTRGLKEKLLARNASVKELSKGVQREMNAGIAGVARMIERLDLTSKRSSSPLIPVHTGGTSGFPEEGKFVEENGIGHSPNEENGDLVHDVSSDAPSLVSSMVGGRMEIPQFVQSGHDAVKI
ncbi:E3 ubiquitin-protein ligase RHF1A-like isoform X2 [Gastrolobium bilobum]|uniref:E3 ubiquitin-protein ligase RHF1A-like isoform X2 n=1 Tax=Gastrolobium bilobum TaxID=150636 RepID=UPI002AAFD2DA|nr:E3 ubiquitin-protein ligase RHF1A-like isoform X2 [Gastrolobium bilobum]